MKRLLISAVLIVGLVLSSAGSVWAASSFATTLVSQSGFNGGMYSDPNDLLGPPLTSVFDTWANAYIKISMAYPAWEDNAITTFNVNQTAVIAFDHNVVNHANGPDFIVFGNSFFAIDGWVSDTTDMATALLTGGSFTEPVTVHVSADNITWHTFSNGPYGDDIFPTQAYEWDSVNNTWGDALDFTKPVPEGTDWTDFKDKSVATVIEDYYQGSGGGTAFDLDYLTNPPAFIRYVKFTGTGGEIDAVSDID